MLMIITILSAGCIKNPFATRTGEDPAGTTGTWETPATPEVVLINLLYAYTELNIQNFQLCFSDDFVFSASEDSIEAISEGNGYLFTYWTKDVEVAATENIFSTYTDSSQSLALILSQSSDYPDSIGDSLAVMYRNYIIRIISTDSLGTDTTLIEGLASFSASKTLFNWWSIYMWSELPSSGTETSWADFKAGYRN